MSRADFPETTKTNFDEFKGKDCVFVANWLKTKGLHKLCFAFEGEEKRSGLVGGVSFSIHYSREISEYFSPR